MQLSRCRKLIAAFGPLLTDRAGKERGSATSSLTPSARRPPRAKPPPRPEGKRETAEPPPPTQPSPAGARPGATPQGRQPVIRPPFRARSGGDGLPPALTQLPPQARPSGLRPPLTFDDSVSPGRGRRGRGWGRCSPGRLRGGHAGPGARLGAGPGGVGGGGGGYQSQAAAPPGNMADPLSLQRG